MRSKLLVIFTAVLLFGLGIAVYAFNSTSTNAETVAVSCCSCCGDSCPMKKAGDKATGEAAHECCCKGDSCPMKAKVAKGGDNVVKVEGEHCCPMMTGKHEGTAGHDMKMANGESCPMMKDGKDSKAHDMHKDSNAMAGMDHKAMSGDSCSCACCSHNKDKKETKVTASL